MRFVYTEGGWIATGLPEKGSPVGCMGRLVFDLDRFCDGFGGGGKLGNGIVDRHAITIRLAHTGIVS